MGAFSGREFDSRRLHKKKKLKPEAWAFLIMNYERS